MPKGEPTFPMDEDTQLTVVANELLMGISLFGETTALNSLSRRLIDLSKDLEVNANVLLVRLSDKMRTMGNIDPYLHGIGIMLENYRFDDNGNIVSIE